ncbi:phosphatase PAP2 family protein [Pontibacter sp. MBLB2868]|uniref:phosphatase PAP2 family protein n=1 Tax=Pontibacter sp. MBLB2868 TaxID=3451555 RepID=UPI003F75564A
MIRKVLLLWVLLLCCCHSNTFAQSSTFPYKIDWVKDGAITAGGIGATVVGSTLITNKPRLTEQDLASLSTDDVNRFDRFAAGNYSASAETASNIPFYGSFVAPLFLLLDQDVQHHAPEIYMMYGEAMSIAGGLYALTAGLIDRKRPNVYAEDAPLDARLHKYATNSFYAGHTAATASATFFVAKVFHDLNPDSPAAPYVWTAAAAVPVAVGYLRLKAGKHFLSDNILGYAIGTSIGILVPELHKHDSRLSLLPVRTGLYDGVAVVYSF